ncbi:MAG TPA: asparaginase [Microthrixaceae bacterium]|nr:asparaginase [Microthrixaceae bacterium]
MALTLIATGGTIASTRNSDGSVSASLSGRDLLDGLPQRVGNSVEVADVQVIDMSVPGSWNLSTQLAVTVADTARAALEGGSDGVVVTHGTDVLEETAWLAELIVRNATSNGPVVFTAAMRHADEFGGDGPRNLADALILAADPNARARGALVCLNGEIHHSRWVRKEHATALCTFVSPGRGPVGEVTAGCPVFAAASPPPAPAVATDREGSTVIGGEVAIVASHWDLNPGLIPWLLDQGTAGLVIEGGGAGNINGNLVDGVLAALAGGVPVVVASRCLAGSVEPIYGGRGGFATLASAGAIGSRGLSAGKARLALQVALGIDPQMSAVETYFESFDL